MKVVTEVKQGEQQLENGEEKVTDEATKAVEETNGTGQEAAKETEKKGKKVEVTQAELDRLRGELKAAKREQEERDKKLKLAEQQRLADEGKFKELAEQAQAELDALKSQAKERDQLEQARKVAERLRFRNPDMAYRLLDRGQIDMDDPAELEQALKRLADDEPYLLRGEKDRTGASFRAGETRLSREQAIEKLKMSGRELAKLSDEEFSALQKAASG